MCDDTSQAGLTTCFFLGGEFVGRLSGDVDRTAADAGREIDPDKLWQRINGRMNLLRIVDRNRWMSLEDESNEWELLDRLSDAHHDRTRPAVSTTTNPMPRDATGNARPGPDHLLQLRKKDEPLD